MGRIVFLILLFAQFSSNLSYAASDNFKKLGGLTCFSVYPAELNDQTKPAEAASCDVLCEQKEALCTGMQNSAISPAVTCSDPLSSYSGVCRCCRIEQ